MLRLRYFLTELDHRMSRGFTQIVATGLVTSTDVFKFQLKAYRKVDNWNRKVAFRMTSHEWMTSYRWLFGCGVGRTLPPEFFLPFSLISPKFDLIRLQKIGGRYPLP